MARASEEIEKKPGASKDKNDVQATGGSLLRLSNK
jgi:hypothetical protein